MVPPAPCKGEDSRLWADHSVTSSRKRLIRGPEAPQPGLSARPPSIPQTWWSSWGAPLGLRSQGAHCWSPVGASPARS